MGKQNRKLIKNMEEYDKKEKAKQQESKIFGQKSIERANNNKKSINVRRP